MPASAPLTAQTSAVATRRVAVDCGDAAKGPIEFGATRPEYVRLSSRLLGWRSLNFERREAPPSSDCLPDCTTEHLVLVSLSGGRLKRERAGETVEHELAPGGRRPLRWQLARWR